MAMTANLPIRALATAAICFATAMVGVAWTREAGNVAALWPSNAIIFAILLRATPGRRPIYLLSFAIAVIGANLAFGDSSMLSAGLAVANLVEVLVALLLVSRFVNAPTRFGTIRDAGRLMLLAGGVAPMLGAIVGAGVLHLMAAAPFFAVWWFWWAADAMGMLVFLPFALLLDPAALRRYADARVTLEHGLFLLAIVGVTYVVMYQTEPLAPILIVPVLMAAATRLDRLGTAAAVVIISVIATKNTLKGIGPLAIVTDQSTTATILDLQLLLGALALPALMIAVLLAERRSALEALADSENRYRAFYDRSPVMLYSTDQQGRLVSVSDYWVNAMGYARSEVLGRPSTELLTAESRHRAIHDVAPRFMESGFVKDVELQHVKKDGEIIDVLVSAIREEDADGKITGSLAVLTDISDRKAAETRIREQEARLRAVIHAALDGVMIIGADGTVELFNPAAEKIFGYDADDVIGRNVGMLIDESDSGVPVDLAGHADPNSLMNAAAKRGPTSGGAPHRDSAASQKHPEQLLKTDVDAYIGLRGEVPGRRKNGTAFPMEISVACFTSGRRQSFVAILRDLTETKRLLRTLEQRAADLKRSNIDLEQFASAASHDLQEPLRKIQTFGAFLKRDYAETLDKEGQYFLDVIVEGAVRLKALVQDLLVYSGVNRDDPVFEAVALDAVLSDILAEMSDTIQETGAVIESEPLPVIVGNDLHLRQLFRNVIDNAIKYRKTGKPPHVTITSEWRAPVAVGESRFLEIRMTDNGIGFDQGYAETIFQPFKRLHSDSEVPGSGIGLAICARVAALHGGTIRAESVEGKGTTIVVTLDPDARKGSDGEQQGQRANVTGGGSPG